MCICCMACLNYMYIHVVPTYIYLQDYIGIDFMMFNATFNNISIISRRSVLLMEETVGPGENHRGKDQLCV